MTEILLTSTSQASVLNSRIRSAQARRIRSVRKRWDLGSRDLGAPAREPRGSLGTRALEPRGGPGTQAQRFRTERIRRASPERMQLFNQFSPDTLRANTFFTLCFLCIRVEVCILRRIRSGPPDTLERIRRSRFILPERIQRSFFRRIRSDPAGYAQIQPDTLRF